MPSTATVIGPGAIGCAAAAALIDAGWNVRFAARTPFDRLDVTHPKGRVIVEADCVTDPADLDPSPLVLLATKAHQTPGAAAWLHAAGVSGTVVAVLQNGVDHEERVAPYVPAGVEILPVMVACPAHRSAPGVVEVSASANLEVPATTAGRLFADAFGGTFVNVRVVEDFTTSVWTKLVLNAAGGGLGTVTGLGNAVFGDHDARALAVAIAEEVAAVGRAVGAVIPVDLPARIIAALATSTHVPSIVVDRLTGRATEWQARNEIVVRRAALHGIDVPLNRMLTTLLRLGEPISLSEAS